MQNGVSWSDTLINEFSTDEIEAVLVHKSGHQFHRDILLLISFGIIVTALGLHIVSMVMNWIVDTFSFHGVADVAHFWPGNYIWGI